MVNVAIYGSLAVVPDNAVIIEKLTMSSKPPRRIVPALPLDDFRPFPLLKNAHAQTVLGAFWPGAKLRQPERKQTVSLSDGDSILIYDCAPRDWQAGQQMALLIHGLTGSGQSSQMQRMTRQLLARGVRVVRMDQRGSGESIRLGRAGCNAGRSDDVRTVLAEMHTWAPASPIALFGTSLGGNLALKLAGEAADQPVPGLERVAAQNPPLDLVASSRLLGLPANLRYDRYYLHHLLREARERQALHPDLPPLRFPTQMTTRLFDELYTAPRGGFVDAEDYYRRTSSMHFVPRSPVPTLVLTARDDPFIAIEPFENMEAPEHIQVVIVPHGGHVAFLGSDGFGGVRWAEQRIVEWMVTPIEKTHS